MNIDIDWPDDKCPGHTGYDVARTITTCDASVNGAMFLKMRTRILIVIGAVACSLAVWSVSHEPRLNEIHKAPPVPQVIDDFLSGAYNETSPPVRTERVRDIPTSYSSGPWQDGPNEPSYSVNTYHDGSRSLTVFSVNGKPHSAFVLYHEDKRGWWFKYDKSAMEEFLAVSTKGVPAR